MTIRTIFRELRVFGLHVAERIATFLSTVHLPVRCRGLPRCPEAPSAKRLGARSGRSGMQAGCLSATADSLFTSSSLPSTLHRPPSTLLLSLLLCLMPAALLADTHTWTGGAGGGNYLATTPANWGGTAPEANDDIALAATSHSNMTWNMTNMVVGSWTQVGYTGIVTIATVYGTTGFTNLNITGNCIISNGVWTQTVNPVVNYEVNRLFVTIGGNLIVGTGAVINVTGKGYAAGNGPGSSGPGNSGGSYGGRGSLYTPIPGPCYGSITAPTNLGSGGGGTAGGGAILLMVGGTVLHNGLLAADGGPATFHTGSGGSIFLTAGALNGSGTIRADGGIASGAWGPGGGGRIALVVTNAMADFLGYTGSLEALGRATGNGSAPGTIYLKKQGDARGELIVKGSGAATPYDCRTDLNGIDAVTYEFSRITLTNNAILNIGANDTLIVTNTVLAGANGVSNGIWISGGTLRVPAVFSYSNFFIGISGTGSTFSPATSLTIGSNVIFLVDHPHVMTSDVIIEAGGNLTQTANSDTEAYKMNLTINGSLTVLPGGGVDVTGKGYAAGYGPGTHTVNACGASHGGLGVGGLSCYGSIVAPTNLGSGGRSGGAGGGAIQLAVSGVISNEGLIRANATPVTLNTGAGGSVFITAGNLEGSGQIQANSATNVTVGNPGGGGRIALAVTNAGADFSAYPANMITAYGGRRVAGSGGAGTIYLRTADKGFNEGVLIVDNDNLTGLTAEISSNVTDAVVGDVILRNKGGLGLDTNQVITVGGIWSNAASFDARLGSQVIFAGGAASTSTVYGSNTFMGLICTNTTGKTIRFEAGNTNTIPAFGRLMLEGSAAATNLTLRSTSDGAPWMLNVNAMADQSVVCVDVKDSDALPSVGAEITAMNSRDSGGNFNWRFIDVGVSETNIWTGNSNTIWSFAENWSLVRTPIADDFILIPSARPRYPVLDNHRTVNGLEIQPGAALSLAGYDLTVRKNAVVAGTIAVSATETVTFRTNVDFTGGAFTMAPASFSTVSLAGSGNQSVNPANLTFHRIEVLNTNTVAFGNGFSAAKLQCAAASGTRNMTFQQGATVILRDLVLQGSAASTNIFLRSSVSSQKWNLAVSGPRWSVQGVDVMDSDASPGLPVPAAFSKDSGNNSNWLFNANATRTEWLGTNGNNFHTANNWSSGLVPDESARVLVESANPMVVTGAVTLLDLTIGGGVGQASVTVNAPLTVIEDIVLMTNGLVTLNRPCVVSNGFYVLAGGTLTHSANSATELNKIDLTAFGNVGVDENGLVDVTGKGYAAGSGPGGATYGNSSGGTYGGRGGIFGTDYTKPCYGSIVAPTNLGSGGGHTAGGGAILIRASGAIRHDGRMLANGVLAGYYAGSGGTISLRAGGLSGIGLVRANGGECNNITSPGGGGRIALVVTNAGSDLAGFTGPVQAYSGVLIPAAANADDAGAGTIYRERAADGTNRGTVLVDNNNYLNSRNTGVPPGPPGNVTNEVEFAPFHIANAGMLHLTNDFMLGNIFLQSTNAWLDLGSNTLTVRSRAHPLGPGVVTNFGAIVWWPDIPKGLVFSTW